MQGEVTRRDEAYTILNDGGDKFDCIEVYVGGIQAVLIPKDLRSHNDVELITRVVQNAFFIAFTDPEACQLHVCEDTSPTS